MFYTKNVADRGFSHSYTMIKSTLIQQSFSRRSVHFGWPVEKLEDSYTVRE